MFSLSAEHQEFYYYNTQSGASQWEHPVDVWCRHVTSLHRQAKTRAHTGQIINAKREKERAIYQFIFCLQTIV